MKQNKKRGDFRLLLITGILVIFGLFVLMSASSVLGRKVGDQYYYFKHQLIFGAIPGIIGLFIASRLSPNFYKKIALPLLVMAILLLVLVLTPLGSNQETGARRWLNIAGFTFQPSEITKLVFVIYLAAWLDKRGEAIKKFRHGLIPFLLLVSIICFLIILQPNASTTGLILMTALVIFYTAGARLSHLISLLVIGFGFATIILTKADYRLNRLLVWKNSSLDPSGKAYQILQALIAIGSGGFWGLGFGESRQKFDYLPEVIGDSIFAVIAEELGWIGITAIVCLYLAFAYCGVKIAINSKDKFCASMAIGITFWIVAQAFINIGAISGLLPLTGIPLPFISYGSSSLLMTMIAVGILYGISRYNKQQEV